ncbi:unnamed protein product [Rhizophagus irregularis]|nr:unnamed protein product [Rhizophagus irregularis]
MSGNVQKIGSGGFGEVYRANWKSSRNYLALKSFPDFNDVTIKEIVKELKIQREVDFHENIIRFFGVTIENSKKYWLVMEYADGALSISQGFRETPIPDTPIDYLNIYTDCWNNEPDNRPTINHVVSKLNEIILKNSKNTMIIEDSSLMDSLSNDSHTNIQLVSNKQQLNLDAFKSLTHDELSKFIQDFNEILSKESLLNDSHTNIQLSNKQQLNLDAFKTT